MEKPFKLEILQSAQTEMEEIAQVHKALSGPQSARRVMDKIYSVMEQLTRFPLSGPPIRDEKLNGAGYRYIVADKYLIFYRLFRETVVIYHIAHGAANYPKLFKSPL